jgi:hypothetical protein
MHKRKSSPNLTNRTEKRSRETTQIPRENQLNVPINGDITPIYQREEPVPPKGNQLEIGVDLFDGIPNELQSDLFDRLDIISLWMCSSVNRLFYQLYLRKKKTLKCLNGILTPRNVVAQHILASRDWIVTARDEDQHIQMVLYYLEQSSYTLQPMDLLYVMRGGSIKLLNHLLSTHPDWYIPFHITNAISAAVQSGNPEMVEKALSYFDPIVNFDLGEVSREFIAFSDTQQEMCFMAPLALPREYTRDDYPTGSIRDCDVALHGPGSPQHHMFARKLYHLTESEVMKLKEHFISFFVKTTVPVPPRNTESGDVDSGDEVAWYIEREANDPELKQLFATARKYKVIIHHLFKWENQYKIDRGKHREINRTNVKEFEYCSEFTRSRILEDALVYAAYWAPDETKVDAIEWICELAHDTIHFARSVRQLHRAAWSTGDINIIKAVLGCRSEISESMLSLLQHLWRPHVWFLNEWTTNREELARYIRTVIEPNSEIEPKSEIDHKVSRALPEMLKDIFTPQKELERIDNTSYTRQIRSTKKTKKRSTPKSMLSLPYDSNSEPELHQDIDHCWERKSDHKHLFATGRHVSYADPLVTPAAILSHVKENPSQYDLLNVWSTLIYKGCTAEQMREAVAIVRPTKMRRYCRELLIEGMGMALLFSRGTLFREFERVMKDMDLWYPYISEYAGYIFSMAFQSGNRNMTKMAMSFWLKRYRFIRFTISPLIREENLLFCESDTLKIEKVDDFNVKITIADKEIMKNIPKFLKAKEYAKERWQKKKASRKNREPDTSNEE